jgi:hypothetical protein
VAVPAASTAASTTAPTANVVQPKFNTTDRFFSASEGPSEQFLNNSSFNEFQSAFFGQERKPIMDKDVSSDFVDSFDGLKDYLQSHDVPESLLIANGAPKSSDLPDVFAGNSEITDSEARMLASEAFQMVPNAAPEVVIDTLREILAAYTEAKKVGLALPPSPEEQLNSLHLLSRKSGTVAELAKSILGRI